MATCLAETSKVYCKASHCLLSKSRDGLSEITLWKLEFLRSRMSLNVDDYGGKVRRFSCTSGCIPWTGGSPKGPFSSCEFLNHVQQQGEVGVDTVSALGKAHKHQGRNKDRKHSKR